MNNTALETYLEPLQAIFSQEGVNEISINRPGEVWVEQKGSISSALIPILDFDHIKGLASLVARSTEQNISEEAPILSATLPNGFRIQIVIPPACEAGTIAMAIRKPSSMVLSLDDYEKMGAFTETATVERNHEINDKLAVLLKENKIKDFLRESVIAKKILLLVAVLQLVKQPSPMRC